MRKEAVRVSLLGLSCAAVILLTQGCSTTGRESTAIIGGGGTPTQAPRVRQPAPQPSPGMHTPAAETEKGWLNVDVTVSARNDAAEALTGTVGDSIEGALVAGGHRISPAAPDLSVLTNISADLYDRSGNYYVYEGTADAVVRRVCDGKLLGRKHAECKGKRELGQSKAQRSLGRKLAELTTEEVRGMCSAGAAGVAATNITVKRPLLSNVLGDNPRYAEIFVRQVTQLSGVISCTILAQDYRSRTFSFRVVYLADSFPAGILNRLSGIETLGLKPVN